MKQGKFRPNLAVLFLNPRNRKEVLACLRTDLGAWQSVQGGLEKKDKNIHKGMEREVKEEIGLLPHQYRILGVSTVWRRYRFPKGMRKKKYIGQEQRWFLAELACTIEEIDLNKLKSNEFSKVKFMLLTDLIAQMAYWKRGVFEEFCKEFSLL